MTVPDSQRYRVLELLGQGGFARVYRAEVIGEGGFRQLVALKFIKEGIERQPELLSRLRDEARILGLIRHRAVVGVHGLAHLDRGWAVVMEYVEGVDCDALIGLPGVPMPVVLEAAAEVASALNAAWVQPIEGGRLELVHRDIKPSNVFLTAGGQVKVLDFGAARASFASRESETRSVMFGSFRYMSPERFQGVDGPECDVWALGITLVELILGCSATPEQVGPPGRQGMGEHLARCVALQLQARHGGSPEESRQELVRLIRECLSTSAAHRPTADDVDLRLRRLSRQFPGDDLRTWAPRNVPALAAQAGPPTERDELCGAVLRQHSEMSVPVRPVAADRPVLSDSGGVVAAERSRSLESAPEAPPAQQPKVRWTFVAGYAAALFLGCAGSLGATAIWANRSTSERVVASVDAPSPVSTARPRRKDPSPRPDVPPPPSAADASEGGATSAKRSAPRPKRSPAPPEPAPESTATTDAASTTSVRITGDIPEVTFMVGGERVPASSVGAGTWTAVGTVNGQDVLLGALTVQQGVENVFNCDATFKSCKRR